MTKFILLECPGYENCVFRWSISLLHLQHKCSSCSHWLGSDPCSSHFASEMWVSSVVRFSLSPGKHCSFKYLTLQPSERTGGGGGKERVSPDGIYDQEKYH